MDAVVELLLLLGRAVEFAHQAGIVRRDLKPANVLLAGDGPPEIADFGLARTLDEGAALTLSGAVLGTPSDMAPQQIRSAGERIGPSTDVYALTTQMQVLDEEPVAPSRLNAHVPRDLRRSA